MSVMFTRNGVQYVFHHLGIPTPEIRPDERYNASFGMYTSDSSCGLMRVQWHRFEADSALDPLIRSVPHAAFKVSDLAIALEGHRLLLAPYEPIEGFRVAIIEDGGIPIEFIETSLNDDEIWKRARSQSSAAA
ncbi:MAG: hypothetical protein JO300_07750 [Silvibacterium sp.]|nr:hypothetical protein [Silvibacterium sp.]